eukprot:TRINITY_DN18549_c0_g1_i1.p1 TRINITY_DN18549_c0_g1~~TRINITY_DN18549_c0_g1_i1.p1  ORF type:complete len:119 (-),score=20.23 TRINITY_DN18549_c0_g1_i1:107-424(-)
MAGLLRAALLALAFLGANAILAKPKHKMHKLNSHTCKVMCQRFGMKSMGKDFESIDNPTECVAKCDQVFAQAPKTSSDEAPTISFAAKPETAGVHHEKRSCQGSE